MARVFGRKGKVRAGIDNGEPTYDYTWDQVVTGPWRINSRVDANRSSIFDIENINSPLSIGGIADQSTLKWDESISSWIIGSDEVGISGKVESSHIVDGEVLDEDVSPEAKINVDKVSGLSEAIDLKVERRNGELFGNLKTDLALIFIDKENSEDAVVNGISLEKLHADLQLIRLTLLQKEPTFSPTGVDSNYLNQEKTFVRLEADDISEVGNNKFLTDERVLETSLSNFDSAIVSADSDGVTANEPIVSALKRFQQQISDYASNQSFDSSTIPSGSVELKHLANDSLGSDDPELSSGDYPSGFLSADNGVWKIKRVAGGLVFKGVWDASSGEAPSNAVKGDLFIAATEGEYNGVLYRTGDWLVCITPPSSEPNAPAEEWLKVNNSGDVVGFQGAGDSSPRDGAIISKVGDYTWEMIDKSESLLSDLTDVDLSLGSGDTLKYVELDFDEDGSIDWRGWTLGEDESGVAVGAISGARIDDNSITSDNILIPNSENLGAQVDLAKFTDLQTTLNDKLSNGGGVLSDNLHLGNSYPLTIKGDKLSGVSLLGLETKIAGIKEIITSSATGLEDKLPINQSAEPQFYDENKALLELTSDNFSEGDINKYFNASRVYQAILNGLSLTQITLIPFRPKVIQYSRRSKIRGTVKCRLFS